MKLRELFPEAYKCYQCLSCTLGCPVARFMDLKPHEALKAVLLGRDEEILASQTPWICASCETCGVRCPNGIDLPALMDLIRQKAAGEGRGGKEVKLHRAFLEQVKKRGRVHELSLVLLAKRLTGLKVSLWELELGLKMFLKGKLKLFPKGTEGIEDLEALFREGGSP